MKISIWGQRNDFWWGSCLMSMLCEGMSGIIWSVSWAIVLLTFVICLTIKLGKHLIWFQGIFLSSNQKWTSATWKKNLILTSKDFKILKQKKVSCLISKRISGKLHNFSQLETIFQVDTFYLFFSLKKPEREKKKLK